MKAKKAIEQVALKNGVSVSQVRRDIREALNEGWNNPDFTVQRYWRSIPSKHEKPTIEEVIDFIAKESKDNLK